MADITFVEQSHEILRYSWDEAWMDDTDRPTGLIANVARTCYKSERRKLPGWDSPYSDVRIEARMDADDMLVKSLRDSGHHAMLEFGWMAVRFKTSIGVSREMVRHRLFSFAEQSTRYCNFGKKGFEFVMPTSINEEERVLITATCKFAADNYEHLTSFGARPEMARAVLPLCTATEINVAGNLRQWRHLFELRTSKAAHPDFRALVIPLLDEVKGMVPVVFDDIEVADD